LADRSSSNESESGSGTHGAPKGPPPGLGEQFGRTRNALFGLIRSHINLARAEFSEIADQVKRALALGGIALLLLFLAGLLIVIGGLLYLGEAIFGSIGWGVLDGAVLLIGTAALLVLAIIDVSWSRALSAFVVALGIGLVVAGLLAVNWSSRPLAILSGAVLIGLLGALLGSSFGRWLAAIGIVIGVFLGALLGLLASFGPGWRVAAAIGVAALLIFWPIVAAVFVFRHGIDTAKLKQRFVPTQTIETTKETIEWVREQMPLGRKS
jgi:hypothetical protein